MLKKSEIDRILKKVLHFSPEGYRILPLPGDASNRRYHRLKPGDPCSGPSLIVMELAEPEAFKQSEEKGTGCELEIHELPFINILKHLEAARVGVPKLYFYEKRKGWLFMEDLGEATMYEALKGKGTGDYELFYRRAIDELLKLQVAGTRLDGRNCLAFGRAFDLPLLMWEIDHFIEYGIEVYKGRKVADRDRAALRQAFEGMMRPVAAEPRVLTHRDYHSRNLILQGDRVRVLDFQDALMGPAQYDLASLLRDSYVSLDDTLIDQLLHYYLDAKSDLEGVQGDPERFVWLFDWVSIQRNLKAAGRFAYIHAVKKNPNYLQYIPSTLSKVKKNLSKYPQLAQLRMILSRYVEELA